MAVPGPVTSAMSVGCHELLRDAARRAPTLVASAAHVLEAVGGLGVDLAEPPERPADARDGLSDVAVRVLDACPVRTGVSPGAAGRDRRLRGPRRAAGAAGPGAGRAGRSGPAPAGG